MFINVPADKVPEGIGMMNLASARSSSCEARTRSGATPVAIAAARSAERVAGSFCRYETSLRVVFVCAMVTSAFCILSLGRVPQMTTEPISSLPLPLFVYVAKTKRPISAPKPKTPTTIPWKSETFMVR